jgi:hypothetical protein
MIEPMSRRVNGSESFLMELQKYRDFSPAI